MKVSKFLKRIEITPAFLVFLCAYCYFDPAHTFTPFLLSVTLHETGHLIALRCVGARIHKVRLGVSGTTIQTVPLRYSHEILVAAAGPMMNFMLLLLLLHKEPVAALLNFCLLCYNLLPVYPLDGGRILRALLHLLLDEKAAEMIEKMVSLACLTVLLLLSCYLTCVWHAGLWPVLVCALLLIRIGETIFPKGRIFALRS